MFTVKGLRTMKIDMKSAKEPIVNREPDNLSNYMTLFSIQQTTRGGFQARQLKNESTGEFVEIIPALGGMVHRLVLKKNEQLHDLLAFDSDQELKINPLFRGRILFPFNDRIPQAQYYYGNRVFHLTPNCGEEPCAIHGLVYDQPFIIISQKADHQRCSLVLEYQIRSERFKGYPFDVSLRIEYVLTVAGFDLKFEIFNQGATAAPLALGWHPYFTFGGSLKGASLQARSAFYLEVGPDLIPTLNFLKTAGSIFDFSKARPVENREMDITLACPENGETTLSGSDGKIILFQDPYFYKYTQIYIPKDQVAIAVEPISAATNAFNFHELGLSVLQPGERIQTVIRVRLD
jgi:aldose 1-epimerase